MTCVSYAHHFIPDNNLSPLRYKFYEDIVLILVVVVVFNAVRVILSRVQR